MRLNLVAASPGLEPGQTRALYDDLDDVAALERRSGRQVHTSVRVGQPADAILTLERELDIDLIVMATHGRSGLGRLMLGSVADRILRASRAPIVLLRPGRTFDRAPADGACPGRRYAWWIARALPGCAARERRSVEAGPVADHIVKSRKCSEAMSRTSPSAPTNST